MSVAVNPISMDDGDTEEDIINQLVDTVNSLEETVNGLEETVQQKDDQIQDLEEENEQLHDRLDKLSDRIQEKTDRIDNLESELENQSQNISGAFSKLSAIDDRIEDASSEDEEEPEYVIQSQDTPLERLLDDPESSGIRPTESVDRAMTIAGHFKEWGKKSRGGRVIKDRLKSYLNTAKEEELSWKQVHRAGHKLEELTDGKIQFKNHSRHGWMLVEKDPDYMTNVVRAAKGT